MRRRWRFEAATIVVVYEIYRFARIGVRGTPERALRNSRALVGVERKLGLSHERTVQRWLLPHEWLIRFFDAYHGEAHFVAVGMALVVLWRTARNRYQHWRNILGWVLVLGLVGFVLVPLTPPRLMPRSFGFVDTAVRIGGFGVVGAEHRPGGGGNEFACLPSLHAAWSLWVAGALWPIARRWWARSLLVLHVVVIHVAVIATAKHWNLDVPAGWATLVAAIAIERTRQRVWASRALTR